MNENESVHSHVEPVKSPSNVIEALSIDNLVFGLEGKKLKILLVRHGEGLSKGNWGLPGGWIRYDEDLRDAAERLLQDLTGVKGLYLEQLKTFGKVNRFPSERVITVAYYALVSAEKYPVIAGFTADQTNWFNIDGLPELIYDHAEILNFGIEHVRDKVRHEPIGFNLLPEKFTLLQLQELYETILNIKLDKPNFRRKMMKMGLLIPCNEKQVGVAHRAASLYRFDPENYNNLTQQGFTFEL